MTDHVFISYSHEHDLEYVEHLAAYLTGQGIPVWFDREIIGGARWAEVIAEKIDASAAVMVVMSPGSQRSRWVGREISRAEERNKTIIPLLREGEPFFQISDIQYVDASTGQMPGPAVLDKLRELLSRAAASSSSVSVAARPYAAVPVAPPPAPAPHQIVVASSPAASPARGRRAILVGLVAVVLMAGTVVGLEVFGLRPLTGRTVANDRPSATVTTGSQVSTPTPTRTTGPAVTPSRSVTHTTPPPPPVDPNAELFRTEGFGKFANGWLSVVLNCGKYQGQLTPYEQSSGVKSMIFCNMNSDSAIGKSVNMAFRRFGTNTQARDFMECQKPAGSPADLDPTKVDLPGTSGSRAGYYCEYFATDQTGSDVNVGISWTDGQGAVSGEIYYDTDSSRASTALDAVRNLWAAHA